jgi:hypothetical protein
MMPIHQEEEALAVFGRPLSLFALATFLALGSIFHHMLRKQAAECEEEGWIIVFCVMPRLQHWVEGRRRCSAAGDDIRKGSR